MVEVSMVERCRVAFVLAIARIERDVRLCELTDDETSAIVTAMIKAMREPTEAMFVAAKKGAIFDPVYEGLFRKGLLANWSAMLSAALLDSPIEKGDEA